MKQDNIDRISKAKAALRGAICGDVIGSFYEWHRTKDYNFKLSTKNSRFTDDTVCSIAVADAITHRVSFDSKLLEWCRKYPNAGYGGKFKHWITDENHAPYGSFGNGSAMRVSSVGAISSSIEECLELAEKSAKVTHDHPEGIKGAQAVALAIFLSLEGFDKDYIKNQLESRFEYDLSRNYEDIQKNYRFQVSCQKSVPEAIIAFLISEDYESAVRRAVAYGGDADTQAAIAGSIAAAFYGEIPKSIIEECMAKLPDEMKIVISNLDKAIDLKNG